jgi:hypothetical protein
MIAWLSADNKNLPRLSIARFRIEEPFKYPFFSPQYFSDFFLLDLQRFDTLVFVADKRDTLLSGTVKRINKVPSEIKVYNKDLTIQIAIYRPDTIYSGYLNNKPTISFFKQLVLFGPSFDDCMDKCN